MSVGDVMLVLQNSSLQTRYTTWHAYHVFTGIKVFNNLQQSIKYLSNDTKQFKLALKNCLRTHSFYSIDEYFNVNRE
jgi:hypothetical protein